MLEEACCGIALCFDTMCDLYYINHKNKTDEMRPTWVCVTKGLLHQ